MGRRYDSLSFLSDLGLDDEGVGVVKAVLRDLAPHVSVVDLTHGIDARDVRGGSLALARSVQYLPAGVVLALVDPVGRRPVAVEVAGGEGILLGPDNGLLAPAVAMAGGAERAVEISSEAILLPSPGASLPARDVFAPAAAHLCNGGELTELGPVIDVHSLLPGVVPICRHEGAELATEVLWVDRFGNVQLNAGPDDVEHLGERVRVRFHDTVRTAVRVSSAAELRPGQLGLVLDGYGLLMLAFDRHAAAAELGLHPGDAVHLGEPDDGDRGTGTPVQVRFRR